MTKKMAPLVVLVIVASLCIAGCIVNPSSSSTSDSRFTTDKWAQFAIQVLANGDVLTPAMLAYMQANHWGLWISTPPLWAGASNYSGNNNVSVALEEFKTEVGPLLANIQHNYGIPVMINLAQITDVWAWGDSQANATYHNAAWYEANFGPIFDYMETWHDGVNGNCLTTYWYEAGWPNFAQWLRNQTTMQIHWGLPAWQDYVNSTPGHDVCTNPVGFSWITGYGNQTTIAQRFALVDEIDIEIWWTSQAPILLNGIRYIKEVVPNMPIGIDSQDQGGFNINLWGSASGLTDHPTTYAEQRAAYTTYIGQLKTGLGRPFDTLMAEWAGNSDGTVQGGSEYQIISNQLQFQLNCGWIT
jgi:hypothetical protein